MVRVRVEISLSESADPRIVEEVVAAAGGEVLDVSAGRVVAEVPGGAMGALATAPGVTGVQGGEPWDSAGRLAPDGPPEVRERLAERDRRAQREQDDGGHEDGPASD